MTSQHNAMCHRYLEGGRVDIRTRRDIGCEFPLAANFWLPIPILEKRLDVGLVIPLEALPRVEVYVLRIRRIQCLPLCGYQ